MPLEQTNIEASTLSRPLFGMYLAFVTDINDPLGRGRIKFRIPGLISPEFPRFIQSAQGFAGSQLGIAWVPEVGDMVFIFFHQANTNHPFYFSGPWAIGDYPTESAVDPLIKTIKTKKFKIVFNDTAVDKLSIESLSGDTKITLDDAAGTITIESSSDVDVKGGADATLEAVATAKVKSGTGDVELGTGTFKAVVIEDFITQINALTFGGMTIDVPLVVTPGTNVSTKVKAAL